jgi:hypothetical protein
MIGASCAIALNALGIYGLPATLGAAAVCFVIRMVGVRFDLNAPHPRRAGDGTADDR